MKQSQLSQRLESVRQEMSYSAAGEVLSSFCDNSTDPKICHLKNNKSVILAGGVAR